MRAFTISGIILPGIGEMEPALFLRCCFKWPIRIQIAQILGLGDGNLCEAGLLEGLPFFGQNSLNNVALFVLRFGNLGGEFYLCW